jgi:hypothetical protein
LGQLAAAARHLSPIRTIPSRDSTTNMGILAARPSTAHRRIPRRRSQASISLRAWRPKPRRAHNLFDLPRRCLSRYQPAFGRSDFYAELRGGDVINLGYSDHRHLDTGEMWNCVSPAAFADLEQVTRISCIPIPYIYTL